MLTKEGLAKKFQEDWKKQYEVKIFKDLGFERKKCINCGKHFWTLNQEKTLCGDSSCEGYGFIGNPIAKKKWDYVKTWKEFEAFFKKHGHESINRYPVIDRWRPDLFFTIASIQDFQRIEHGNMVMDYPADPLIVPQVCLRFPDIQNVGITGRHHTSFVMSGQHSFGKYWKDETIRLNFHFLNKIMGIPAEEITYIEDVWSMPDFSQFGPSLETVSKGLELCNSVFSQYSSMDSSNYKELPQKVIDVGWGHERLVWFSNGTPTGYDTVFEPVVSWMRKQSGIQNTDLFEKYAIHAGSLDVDEIKNIAKAREAIARTLGVDLKELISVVEPLQAMYAIADHSKTLLFAIADGGMPSNVGGGYNLRVILRRMLSFIKELNLDFDVVKIAELHSKQLKPMFPELSNGMDSFQKMLDVESKRYEKTAIKAEGIIKKSLQKGGLKTEELIKLYTSDGITPELIEKFAKANSVDFNVPDDFYRLVTETHTKDAKEEKETLKVDVSGIQNTELLYQKTPYKTDFSAKILKNFGGWVALDKTLFYPESGGQEHDKGTIIAGNKEYKVEDVKKVGNVVLHKINGFKTPAGHTVEGRIDWDRRYKLMRMHTATHLLGGAARKILGNHVWQSGAKKDVDFSRLDLTHYEAFTIEEIKQIEKMANEMIKKSKEITSAEVERQKAEKEFGFDLYQGYQGGATPGKVLRVIDIADGFDIEACGGTHVKNTSEIGIIKIVSTERIQDGVNRIEFTCGESALNFILDYGEIYQKSVDKMEAISPIFRKMIDPMQKQVEKFNLVSGSIMEHVNQIDELNKKSKISVEKQIEMFRSFMGGIPEDTKKFMEFLYEEIEKSSRLFSVSPRKLPKTVEKFTKEIADDHIQINEMRTFLGKPPKSFEAEDLMKEMESLNVKFLHQAVEIIFGIWKDQKKEIEKLRKEIAKSHSKDLSRRVINNQVFEIIQGERMELIEIASMLISQNPELTVILANQGGEIIGMSRREDMGALIKEIASKTNGSGGGKKELAQGKVELSKLIKLIEDFHK